LLSLSNRVLTWDNCKRRPWQGPGRCILCKKDDEKLDHLLSFTGDVWEEVLKFTDGKGTWQKNSLVICLENWIKYHMVKEHKALSCIVSWDL